MTDGIVAFTTRTECGSPVRRHAKPVRAWGTVADAVDGKGVTLRGLPHIPPNEPCSPVSFRRKRLGRWRWRELQKVGQCHARPASPDVLELVPELRDFVPPAGVIDRLGCGQQDSLPPSVRPTDGQRPFFAHLGANAQHSFHKRCSRKAVQAEGSS